MAYLGNKPVNNFVSFAKQNITGNGGTSYSLDYPVTGANDIELFINNVRQEPTEAYSASGATLTLTGAITSTDDVYVIFRGRALGTVGHPADQALEATTGTFSGAITSDGNSVLTSASPIGFKSVQIFTSSGTYTKPSGINTIFVIVTGGGGSGGSQGTGGGAGGTAMKLIDATGITTETVTVSGVADGGGGTSDGINGGTSSFGSHCSATGGNGGLNGTTIEQPALGGIGSGGDFNLRGGYGHLVRGGGGGSSFWGAVENQTTVDTAGNWGGGGRGGPGGIAAYTGSGGVVVVYEYVSY